MKSCNNFPPQNKIRLLDLLVCHRIEELLYELDANLRFDGNKYVGKCVVHGGDNYTALCFSPERDEGSYWKCFTHHCDGTFNKSAIGFIRGVLSHQKYDWSEPGDRMISFQSTVDYICHFLRIDFDKIELAATPLLTNRNVYNIQRKPQGLKVPREHVLPLLSIPAKYYIERGYSPEILRKYDVGLCTHKNKPMRYRVVVPVYDAMRQFMVGCSGRSINPLCETCECYHIGKCPSEDYRNLYSKWRHSKGFAKSAHLFNMWYAQPYIKQSKTIILVESVGNVMKLEESGIHNSLGLFGNSLSDAQLFLIEQTGATKLRIALDNDEAGEIGKKKIEQKCSRDYKLEFIDLPSGVNDIAELLSTQIKELLNEK